MASPLDTATREVAKELYIQGFELSKIADTTKAKIDTIRKWAVRGDWTGQRAAVQAVLVKAVSPQVRALVQQGERSKQLVADEVELALKTLAKAPPLTVHELLENEGRTSRVAGLKALAETAALIHGWSKDGSSDGLSSLRRFDEAIDVTPCDATETPASEPKAILDVPENTM